MGTITKQELLAMNLLNLVKHHKLHCNEPHCGVSLSLFRELYENLLGRKSTDEESKCFW